MDPCSPGLPLAQELQFALDLASQCADIAMQYRSDTRRLNLVNKPGGKGPVTDADHALNQLLVRTLRATFPEDAIVAEESLPGQRWQEAHRCWFVDPIDGTGEFVRGGHAWTVQLGLTIEGIPSLGVVAEPSRHRVSWAIATRDGHRRSGQRTGDETSRPLILSERELVNIRMIGPTAPRLSRPRAIRQQLGVPRSRYTPAGSIGVRLTSVARGDADAYVQAPGRSMTWDTCGPSVLVTAAGGIVTDLYGVPLNYRGTTAITSGIIATRAEHHGAILKKLAPLAAKWRFER